MKEIGGQTIVLLLSNKFCTYQIVFCIKIRNVSFISNFVPMTSTCQQMPKFILYLVPNSPVTCIIILLNENRLN